MFNKIKNNRPLLSWIVLTIISLVTFSIVTFINWSLLTGYIVGSIVSIISYYLNKFYVSQLLSKRRSFKLSFFLTQLKTFFWLFLVAGTLIGILFANNLLTDSWIDGIFNVFSFIFGCVMIQISFIVAYLFSPNKKRSFKKERG